MDRMVSVCGSSFWTLGMPLLYRSPFWALLWLTTGEAIMPGRERLLPSPLSLLLAREGWGLRSWALSLAICPLDSSSTAVGWNQRSYRSLSPSGPALDQPQSQPQQKAVMGAQELKQWKHRGVKAEARDFSTSSRMSFGYAFILWCFYQLGIPLFGNWPGTHKRTVGEPSAPEDLGTFWWSPAVQLASQGWGESLSFAQKEHWHILYGADIWANLQEHECKCRQGEKCRRCWLRQEEPTTSKVQIEACVAGVLLLYSWGPVPRETQEGEGWGEGLFRLFFSISRHCQKGELNKQKTPIQWKISKKCNI